RRIFGEDAEPFGYSSYPGDKTALATVLDELHTIPFLGSQRLVVVEAADPFVTKYRAALEAYVAAPSKNGTLVLEVKSWPANTRLAKLIDEDVTVVCKAPAAYRLPQWCVRWAAKQHDKELSLHAAQLLVELVGTEMGLLDQEILKLAIYVGDHKRIDVDDVDKRVGCSRIENTWKVFDAIGSGQAKEALSILDRAIEQGEEPMR